MRTLYTKRKWMIAEFNGSIRLIHIGTEKIYHNIYINSWGFLKRTKTDFGEGIIKGIAIMIPLSFIMFSLISFHIVGLIGFGAFGVWSGIVLWDDIAWFFVPHDIKKKMKHFIKMKRLL